MVAGGGRRPAGRRPPRARPRQTGPDREGGAGAPPPEKTFAEEFYYRKQMAGRTPMVVRMLDGESLQGWIEWYDRDCLKLNRRDGPNLLVMKAAIRYMHKDPGAAKRVSSATSGKTGIRASSDD